MAADFTRLGVRLVHDTTVATPDGDEYTGGKLGLSIEVANSAVQAIECVSSDLSGHFDLYLLGAVVRIPASSTLSEFQELMHAHVPILARAAGQFLHPPQGDASMAPNASASAAVYITAANGIQKTVCAHRDPSPILLSFQGLAANRGNAKAGDDTSFNYGTLPIVNVTSSWQAVVKAYGVVTGLDSVSYLGAGLYQVFIFTHRLLF